MDRDGTVRDDLNSLKMNILEIVPTTSGVMYIPLWKTPEIIYPPFGRVGDFDI